MKYLILLLFPAGLYAQNWNLITAHSNLNFSPENDGAVDVSLYVARAFTLNGDSAFVVEPRAGHFLSMYPYIGFGGSLLADTVLRLPGGVYECRYMPNGYWLERPFRIRTLAQAGESWDFDDATQAEVLSAGVDTVFGSVDSVKTIALSSGDTLRLSKNYGPLQIAKERLVGLEGAGAGVQLPNNLAWYDWAPGDSYEYERLRRSDAHKNRIWDRLDILAKVVTDTAINFSVRQRTRTEAWINDDILLATTYTDTLAQFSVAGPKAVYYPGIFLEDASLPLYRQCVYQKTNAGFTMTNNSIATPSGSNPYTAQTFETGLGQTYKEFRFGNISYVVQNIDRLTGYQKNGQAPQGSLHPLSFFTATHAPQAAGPKIYPLPAGDRLFIDGLEPGAAVLLNSCTGRPVFRGIAAGTLLEIPLGQIPPGLYCLQLYGTQGPRAYLVPVAH